MQAVSQIDQALEAQERLDGSLKAQDIAELEDSIV